MGLESATYISDLVATNPTTGDPRNEGDDHLRAIKSAVKTTFPNISGAVTPTHTELNYVSGARSNLQTQVDVLSSITNGWRWRSVTSDTIASISDACLIDSSGGTFTLYLPSGGTTGNQIRFVDVGGALSTNSVIINPLLTKLEGVAGGPGIVIVNWDNIKFDMVYVDSTIGWKIL